MLICVNAKDLTHPVTSATGRDKEEILHSPKRHWSSTMSLGGKVIIVTGSAQGLGREYAIRLAQEGAAIVVADLDSDKARQVAEAIKETKGKAESVKVDVTDQESTARMVVNTVRSFGRVDVLVNNAAFYYGLKKKPFTEIATEEWDKMMNVNLKGCWLCSKAVFPEMKKQGKGKIINITSSSFFTGVPYMAHYVASKGGVIGFTRALSRELGQYNITVNALAPGYTVTEASMNINPDESFNEKRVMERSLRREEHPKDVAGTLAFLASDYSDFITGQTILVDGGVSHI